MSEKPILFSGAMVRAILDGKKRMTRRIVKNVPQGADLFPMKEVVTGELWAKSYGIQVEHKSIRCPFSVGQILWVREAFCFGDKELCDCLPLACRHRPEVHYRADWAGIDDDVRRKPSIHMPRWASRLTLRVTEARVERLQDISEEDAIAEGVGEPKAYPYWPEQKNRIAFQELWDSINAKRGFSWASNPWVWVIGFERVESRP